VTIFALILKHNFFTVTRLLFVVSCFIVILVLIFIIPAGHFHFPLKTADVIFFYKNTALCGLRQ